MREFGAVTCLLLLVLFAGAKEFVYVSVSGEKRIAIYEMKKDGKLAHVADVSVAGAPGSLAVDPKRQFLFASLRSTEQLASFRIDPKSGKLEKISEVPAGGNASYVATDHNGKFLLSAYYNGGKVAVHPIDANGVIGKKPTATRTTAAKAHAILPDRSNKFVFVPHTGPNLIFQFRFDPMRGTLAPNFVSKVHTPKGTEPRHLWFHPNGRFAYFDNEKGSSVTAFKLNKDGTLQPFQTLPTLPKDFDKRNTCADLEMTPSGKFLYAANRGHDSLAGYEVDPKTGKLRSIGQFSTEKTPRSFNISPNGRFLYAAGQSSGKLAAYRLNRKTGKLTRFATYEAGKSPAWVMVVSTPK